MNEELGKRYQQLTERAQAMGWKKEYPASDWSEEHVEESSIEMKDQEELYLEYQKLLETAPQSWCTKWIQFPLSKNRLLECKENYTLQLKWQKWIEELRSLLPPEKAISIPQLPVSPEEIRVLVAQYKDSLPKMKRDMNRKVFFLRFLYNMTNYSLFFLLLFPITLLAFEVWVFFASFTSHDGVKTFIAILLFVLYGALMTGVAIGIILGGSKIFLKVINRFFWIPPKKQKMVIKVYEEG